MDERKRLGNRGEEEVARWLRGHGYRVLASQYRCRFGEIDLIARSREGVLCFVEVKTRSAGGFAAAREAVTAAKQRRLRTTAQLYLAQTGEGESPCRFDVAEVYPGPMGYEINYIANAF